MAAKIGTIQNWEKERLRVYGWRVLAFGLLGIGVLFNFLFFQLNADDPYISALIGGTGATLDLIKALLPGPIIAMFMTRSPLSWAAGGLLLGFYLFLAALSFSASNGVQATMYADGNAQRYRASEAYSRAETDRQAAMAQMQRTAYAVDQRSQAETSLADLQLLFADAQAKVSQYANPDGTPKTDRNGLSYKSKAAQWIERARTYKAQITEQKQIIADAAAHQLAIAERSRAEARLDGSNIAAGGETAAAPFVLIAWFLGLFGWDMSAIGAQRLMQALLALAMEGGQFTAHAMARRIQEKHKPRYVTLRAETPDGIHYEHNVMMGGEEDNQNFRLGFEQMIGGVPKYTGFSGKAHTRYLAGRNAAAQLIGEDMEPDLPEIEPVVEIAPQDVPLMRAGDNTQRLQPWVVRNLIRRGDYLFIHAGEGVGKTWLMLALARLMAQGGSLLERWHVDDPARVLMIDGEMTAPLMQDRMRQMGIDCAALQVLSFDQMPEGQFPNITTAQGQAVIEAAISQARPDVLFIDNRNSLSHQLAEGSTGWSLFEQWIGSLTARGIATVVFDHDNDKGQLSGSRKKLTAVVTRLQLTDLEGNWGENASAFTVDFRKHRNLTGELKAPIKVLNKSGHLTAIPEKTRPSGQTATQTHPPQTSQTGQTEVGVTTGQTARPNPDEPTANPQPQRPSGDLARTQTDSQTNADSDQTLWPDELPRLGASGPVRLADLVEVQDRDGYIEAIWPLISLDPSAAKAQTVRVIANAVIERGSLPTPQLIVRIAQQHRITLSRGAAGDALKRLLANPASWTCNQSSQPTASNVVQFGGTP